MKARLLQFGCWTLMAAIVVGAGAFAYVFAETFNFTGEPHPGRFVLGLYAIVLTGMLLQFAYQQLRRRTQNFERSTPNTRT